MAMERTPSGFTDFVQQTDAVGMGVLVLLLLMSAASWTVVFIKAWRNARGHARAIRSLEAFWQAPSLQEAVNAPGAVGRDDPFAALAQSAERAQRHYRRQEQRALGAQLDFGEFVTRQLRAAIARATARLEWGQTLLASVGSTAPFIGLFGTVWGIYHALASIGNSGQATLDKVAGPVGEALIMTGLGLAVAIPAVLAYNAFTRQNRVVLAELDAFAHDLHAWLTTGARVERVETAPPAQARPAPKGV
jgi:biopolymer transport protein ExbB